MNNRSAMLAAAIGAVTVYAGSFEPPVNRVIIEGDAPPRRRGSRFAVGSKASKATSPKARAKKRKRKSR